jgi:transcriptional regulator with XRE-family HTH domain
MFGARCVIGKDVDVAEESKVSLPPTVMRVLLGHELRRLRAVAGVTQHEAADLLHCSQAKIVHVESGTGIRAVELDALLDHYGASDTDRTYTRALQRETIRRTKRGAFSTRFRQYMRLLVDMEPSCQSYCTYRGMVIPGLLQTEEYARAVFRTARPSPSADQIDRDTADRMARQRVLDNTGQTFWFVIDEAALHRGAGSPEVMKRQLKRLIETIDRPNVDLQIIPFSTGYYVGEAHDYTIFGFETKIPVSIVFLEHHNGGEYADSGERTAEYLTLWEQQRAAAFGPEQSRRYLLDMVKSA